MNELIDELVKLGGATEPAYPPLQTAARLAAALMVGWILGLVYRWTYTGARFTRTIPHTQVLLTVGGALIWLVVGNNLVRAFGLAGTIAPEFLYQVPTCHRNAIATSAASENQPMLAWPRGSTTKAASSGPSDEPALPPTWNSDCAKPWRPPDATRAIRDDSGWKIDDPTPTSAAAASCRRSCPPP